jgi:hypothetical protein
MANHDLLGADQHFPDQETHDPLAFLQRGVLCGIVQPGQEAFKGFRQFEILLPIQRAIRERVEVAASQ